MISVEFGWTPAGLAFGSDGIEYKFVHKGLQFARGKEPLLLRVSSPLPSQKKNFCIESFNIIMHEHFIIIYMD